MKIITETKRLQLREFCLSDSEDLFAMNADPQVLRYTGDEAFASVHEAERFLDNYRDYQEIGFGRWAVISRETGKFLGWCGLKKNEEGLIDIGFRFYREKWGKGYATESAKAVLAYGFEALYLKEIIGRASRQNKASLRVLEKLGMVFWKYGPCEGIQDAVYYRMTYELYENSDEG